MTPNQVTITKILRRGEDFVTSLHNIPGRGIYFIHSREWSCLVSWCGVARKQVPHTLHVSSNDKRGYPYD